MLDRIRPPATLDFRQAWSYVQTSRAVLAKEIIDLRKSISYTGLVLKDEMKELGSTFEEIEKTLGEADSILRKTRVDEIETIRESIGAVAGKISEAKTLDDKIKEAEEDVKRLEEEEKGELSSAGKLRESAEMKEMDEQLGKKSEASRRKQELKGKLIEKLGTVEKPMQRFSQMVESRKHLVDKELEDILRLYMTNPFIAIKRDPKGGELKKILQEVRQLVEKGSITLKDDREKEKKLEALDGLLEYNFFDEIFWEMNKADVELNKADKELSGMKVYSDISSREEGARKKRKEIEEKASLLSALSDRRRACNDQLEARKRKCEELASAFFGQNVFLRLDE